MRKLVLFATGLFWLAVAVFAASGTTTPTARAPQAVVAEKRYTLADVARHAVEADCWMAIDGAVYDLTAYLPEHPTRPSVIVPWCGKEASEAYKTKTRGRPHSPEATRLLAAYRIGVLARP
jgi:cytochrome b involved in lipid metabolism